MSDKITVLFTIQGLLHPARGQAPRSVLPGMLEDSDIFVDDFSISSDGRILTASMTSEEMASAQKTLEGKCLVRQKLDPCK